MQPPTPPQEKDEVQRLLGLLPILLELGNTTSQPGSAMSAKRFELCHKIRKEVLTIAMMCGATPDEILAVDPGNATATALLKRQAAERQREEEDDPLCPR